MGTTFAIAKICGDYDICGECEDQIHALLARPDDAKLAALLGDYDVAPAAAARLSQLLGRN